MENISLLLSGECSKELPYISSNSDENWDVTAHKPGTWISESRSLHVAAGLVL